MLWALWVRALVVSGGGDGCRIAWADVEEGGCCSAAAPGAPAAMAIALAAAASHPPFPQERHLPIYPPVHTAYIHTHTFLLLQSHYRPIYHHCRTPTTRTRTTQAPRTPRTTTTLLPPELVSPSGQWRRRAFPSTHTAVCSAARRGSWTPGLLGSWAAVPPTQRRRRRTARSTTRRPRRRLSGIDSDMRHERRPAALEVVRLTSVGPPRWVAGGCLASHSSLSHPRYCTVYSTSHRHRLLSLPPRPLRK